jgi:glycosyltransferase involved in cell wall biosynthesis
LSPFLSVVVPVRNVQTLLPRRIERLLECAADLTSHFELVLIDDGSIDQTPETARELSRRYPQIRLLVQSPARGAPAAIERGLQIARGRVTIVMEAGLEVSPSRLRELWQSQQHEQALLAQAQAKLDANTPNWLRQLLRWGQQLRETAPAGGGIGIERPEAAGTPELSQEDVQRLILQYRQDVAHPQPPVAKGGSFLQHLRNLAIGE